MSLQPGVLFLLSFVSSVVRIGTNISATSSVGGYPWLEQISRQEEVSQACANLRSSTTEAALNVSELEHLLVDHQHRLLYCYVPKIACTNWKRVLMVLTGVSNSTNPLDIPATLAHDDRSTLRLSRLPTDDAKRILDTYTTFLVVRHPFERLLSAYRNKFLQNTTSANYFQERYGRHIVKKYRAGVGNDSSPATGTDVTFLEFVRYLIEEGGVSNEHWAPVEHLCRPCHVHYHLVARYERMAEDARTLLEYVGAPPLNFPLTRQGGTGRLLRHYFQQLDMGRIEGLYNLYKQDFLLFNYHLEDILGFDIG